MQCCSVPMKGKTDLYLNVLNAGQSTTKTSPAGLSKHQGPGDGVSPSDTEWPFMHVVLA